MGLLTHCPLGWINFPRKSRVSFKYKSTIGCACIDSDNSQYPDKFDTCLECDNL